MDNLFWKATDMRNIMFVVLIAGVLLTVAVIMRTHRSTGQVPASPVPATSKEVPEKQTHTPPVRPDRKETNRGSTTAVLPPQPVVHPYETRPTIDWTSVRPEIRLIAGRTTAKGYSERVRAVHRLGARLDPKEVTALYAFLDTRFESQQELDKLAFNAIKNDVIDRLMQQDALPAALGDNLVRWFRDKTFDATWRNYCVQFFSIYYETRWNHDDASRLNDPGRAELMHAFDEALAERDQGIAGTALLGLTRLSERYSEIDLSTLGRTALTIAQDEKADVPSRIAAVNVCGMTSQAAILPQARMYAQTAEPLPLRLASISTLGMLGTQEDR